jgi:hypothetical protein
LLEKLLVKLEGGLSHASSIPRQGSQGILRSLLSSIPRGHPDLPVRVPYAIVRQAFLSRTSDDD